MALLGRSVPAAEVLTWGLVNEVTDPGNLRSRSLKIAATLAALSTSVGATRKLLTSRSNDR